MVGAWQESDPRVTLHYSFSRDSLFNVVAWSGGFFLLHLMEDFVVDVVDDREHRLQYQRASFVSFIDGGIYLSMTNDFFFCLREMRNSQCRRHPS